MTEPVTQSQAPDHLDRWSLRRDVVFLPGARDGQLLDFGRAQFYGLDAIGAKMVALALSQGQASATRRIAEDYAVDVRRVADDLDALGRKLSEVRLVDQGGAKSSSAGPRVIESLKAILGWALGPVVAFALDRAGRPPGSLSPTGELRANRVGVAWLLMVSWVLLRTIGLSRTVGFWRLGRASREGVPDARLARTWAESVDRAVRDAAARSWFFPSACKERAVVGQALIRGVGGSEPTLVLGVQPYPFLVHSWVESYGSILTDDRDYCQAFEPIARLA